MAEYAVSFDKLVCHGGAMPSRFIEQGHFLVTARSSCAAVEAAKRLFVSSHNIRSWQIHADRIRVVRAEPFSDQGRPRVLEAV